MAGNTQGGRPRAVVIAGPTASGKSALALHLAERLGGVVINADSMQVYRELRILTARPSPEEEGRAPHRLYGHVPAAEGYTVARWLRDMETTLADVEADGRLPIVVGGTGLYLTALTKGLSEVPPIPAEIRTAWRAAAETAAGGQLHAELAARDPVMAGRLRPDDTQRILRAIEVLDATGRSLADWQAERSRPLLPEDAIRALVIAPERAALHAAIARRFEAMVTNGGLEEAAAFAALRLDPSLPAAKAIGVPELVDAAIGASMIGDAVARAVTATRQYAKRQETWFRNQMPAWPRVTVHTSEALIRELSTA